jgi:hypothetical protein
MVDGVRLAAPFAPESAAAASTQARIAVGILNAVRFRILITHGLFRIY